MATEFEINVSDIEFVMAGQYLNQFNNPLFNLKDGTPIHAGDTVQFYVDDQIFPYSGTVQNINGLKVGCFSQILNKWRYLEHNIDLIIIGYVMTPQQKKLRDKIKCLGRILNKNEVFDFYTENVMKNFMSCRLYKPNYSEDYSLWELEDKSSQWHKLNLGSLIIQGELEIK